MNKEIIQKIKSKIKKDYKIINMLRNSNIKDRLIFNSIVREASTYALDILASEILKSESLAVTITNTTHLEYTEKALNEIIRGC